MAQSFLIKIGEVLGLTVFKDQEDIDVFPGQGVCDQRGVGIDVDEKLWCFGFGVMALVEA